MEPKERKKERKDKKKYLYTDNNVMIIRGRGVGGNRIECKRNKW